MPDFSVLIFVACERLGRDHEKCSTRSDFLKLVGGDDCEVINVINSLLLQCSDLQAFCETSLPKLLVRFASRLLDISLCTDEIDDQGVCVNFKTEMKELTQRVSDAELLRRGVEKVCNLIFILIGNDFVAKVISSSSSETLHTLISCIIRSFPRHHPHAISIFDWYHDLNYLKIFWRF